MPILPLPVFEADADPSRRDAMTDEETYARLTIPKSLVVRFGSMKMIAEFRYDGEVKPGCGTKMVARTFRGTEIVEMLTTTCENSGCNKSITRREMLEYIENSGGKDFPFHTNGLILRVATIEELNRFASLEAQKPAWLREVREMARARGLDTQMKVVEVEPILGEEVLTVYYMSEERVDFRDLVKDIAARFAARIEMRQVGARDEARLVADYERCGQHCCCKNFLKVLKPISMRAAKMQKATLDPLKISGRCGRLMCCLRYEDQTYTDLKQRLPHRKTRVGTSSGPGIVLDSKILAQLVLVQLEHNGEEIAVPVEELMDPETCPTPDEAGGRVQNRFDDPLRGMSAKDVESRVGDAGSKESQSKDRQDRHRGRERSDEPRVRGGQDANEDGPAPVTDEFRTEQSAPERDDFGRRLDGAPDEPPASSPPQRAGAGGHEESEARRGRHRRRRRGPGEGRGPDSRPPTGDASRRPSNEPREDGAGRTESRGDGSPESGGGRGVEGGPGGERRRRRRRRRGRGRGPDGSGGPPNPPSGGS